MFFYLLKNKMISKKIPKRPLQELVLKVKRGLSSYYFQEEGSEVCFINIGDIEDGRINASKVSTVRVKDTGALENSIIEANDVIISIKGPAFRALIADKSVEGYVISANLIAFKLNEEILPEIVAAYLNSPRGQSELKSRSAGELISALNLKSLMEIRIPIPDVNRQKMFAEYLALSDEHSELVRQEREIREKLNAGMIQKLMTQDSVQKVINISA